MDVGRVVDEPLQGELRGVVEGLAGFLFQDAVALVHQVHLDEPGVSGEDLVLGGFEEGVEAADDGHGEDDVAVFGAVEGSPEDIVGDVPDKADHPGVLLGVHRVRGLLDVMGPYMNLLKHKVSPAS